MKKALLLTAFLCSMASFIVAQSESNSSVVLAKANKELNGLYNSTCQCIEDISESGKYSEGVAQKVLDCIHEKVIPYQIIQEMIRTENLRQKGQTENLEVVIARHKYSWEYRGYYKEINNYLLEHCDAMIELKKTETKMASNLMSNNDKAVTYYNKGVKASQNRNYQKAVEWFKKATIIDPNFVIAWDNVGFAYQHLGNHDRAIEAYKKSLSIFPKGEFAMQSIAPSYQETGRYQDAVDMYKELVFLKPNDGGVYHTLGMIYAVNLSDLEVGLDYLGQAYKIYDKKHSPKLLEVEKAINQIYTHLHKKGQTEIFYAMVKRYGLEAQ